MLLPLYLRREPTTDQALLAQQRATGIVDKVKRFDVVAYADPAMTEVKARWSWYYDRKPRRNCPVVMLNCFPWAAKWRPDLPHPA